MRRLGVLALIVVLVMLARQLPAGPTAHELAAGMALGLLLLGAYLSGWLTGRLNLPRITGYIAFGLLAGPQVMHLLERPLIADLGPVDGVAVVLIALNAGAELRFSWLKQHATRIGVITGLQLVAVVGLVPLLLVVFRPYVPFLEGLDATQAFIVSLVVGVVLASSSPLVILAIGNESRARGPVSDTLLGVAIAMDLMVVVGMAIVLGVAESAFGAGEVTARQVTLTLLREIGGSLLLGAALGGLLVAYVRLVGRELALVVAGLCLAISEVSIRVHLEPLLVAIAAGMVLINFGGPRSARFVHAVERVSLPVYALFFGLLGANLDLSMLVKVGAVGGVLVLVRGGLLWGATSVGARLSGAEEGVRRFGWMGFVSQAGVTLGIAVMVARTFPDWGPAVRNLVVGMTAVNTLVGPVLHRVALVKTGEAGAADRGEEVGRAPA